MGRRLALLLLLLAAEPGYARSPANVLVVVNDNSPISRTIADYYMRRREIPVAICATSTQPPPRTSAAPLTTAKLPRPSAIFLKNPRWWTASFIQSPPSACRSGSKDRAAWEARRPPSIASSRPCRLPALHHIYLRRDKLKHVR